MQGWLWLDLPEDSCLCPAIREMVFSRPCIFLLLFKCRCRKETQVCLCTFCSQESKGSSWELAPCPAQGRQLQLVIPWTLSAGLDKAALAQHIRLFACFPATLTSNQALIRLKCKVEVSADAMSTSLCSRNVARFLICTTSTILHWAGGKFSQSGLAKSLELEPENTGLWD